MWVVKNNFMTPFAYLNDKVFLTAVAPINITSKTQQIAYKAN